MAWIPQNTFGAQWLHVMSQQAVLPLTADGNSRRTEQHVFNSVKIVKIAKTKTQPLTRYFTILAEPDKSADMRFREYMKFI